VLARRQAAARAVVAFDDCLAETMQNSATRCSGLAWRRSIRREVLSIWRRGRLEIPGIARAVG